jgi:hypothetical protein
MVKFICDISTSERDRNMNISILVWVHGDSSVDVFLLLCKLIQNLFRVVYETISSAALRVAETLAVWLHIFLHQRRTFQSLSVRKEQVNPTKALSLLHVCYRRNLLWISPELDCKYCSISSKTMLKIIRHLVDHAILICCKRYYGLWLCTGKKICFLQVHKNAFVTASTVYKTQDKV